MTIPRSGSNLERVLSSGTFAVTAEIAPDASGSPARVRAEARTLRGQVDAVNVTDAQRARVRISALAAAALVLQEGVEPVLQMTTRDRNRIALQSDLLGAHALGVRNVLCLRGDEVSEGNEPDAKPVFEFTSEEMVRLVRTLRDEGTLAGGDAVEEPPRFLIGATASPFGRSIEESVINLRAKVDAGADFVQTQPVFDAVGFDEWMRIVRKEWLHEKARVLAGVMPLRSPQMVQSVAKVPGILIPKEVRARIQGASDAKAEGLRIAVETVVALRKVEGVAGVHVMPVGWVDAVPAIVRGAGLLRGG